MSNRLEGIKTGIENLKLRLPDKIDSSKISNLSILPFKVSSLLGSLFYRYIELADESYNLFKKNLIVTPTILTRSALETAAYIYWLFANINNFIDNKDVEYLDNFLMKMLFGSKDNPNVPDPYNVLTAIDHVDKSIKGIRKRYDSLSEIAHPNWYGTYGAFSELDKDDKDNLIVKHGAGCVSSGQGIIMLQSTVALVKYSYGHIIVRMPLFIEKCEEC